MDMNLSKLWEIVKDRDTWCAAVQGVWESDVTYQLNNSQGEAAKTPPEAGLQEPEKLITIKRPTTWDEIKWVQALLTP